VIQLRAQKRDAARLRRNTEKELQDAKSSLRRSKSGLASADRRIAAAHEALSDISLVLNQEIAQKDSILRLIEGAERRLGTERGIKKQAERDESADTGEEKMAAQRRLRTALERISDIEFEIKNRKKMVKKLADAIGSHSSTKSRITEKIHKASQTKPGLRSLLKSSLQDCERLTRRVMISSKQEISASKRLKKAEEKLKAQLAKKSKPSKKRSPKPKKPSAKRPARRARPARKQGPKTAAKRPAGRTKKARR